VIVGDREAGCARGVRGVRAGELPAGGVPVPGDSAEGQGQYDDGKGEGESAGAGDKRRRQGQVKGYL
jgi:hypothetical protein